MQYVNEDRHVYCETTGAIYGLVQAGQITHLDLVKHLKPFEYYPSKQTPGLWFHKTKPVTFTLIVDDFGVKYIKKNTVTIF